MFYYTMWIFVHLTHLVLSSATLSNEIFCGSHLVQNHVFCACNNIETNFIPQPHEKKVIGGKHNVLAHYVNVFAPDSSGAVLCNTFKSDILLCVHIHLISLNCMLCVSLHCETPVGLQD